MSEIDGARDPKAAFRPLRKLLEELGSR